MVQGPRQTVSVADQRGTESVRTGAQEGGIDPRRSVAEWLGRRRLKPVMDAFFGAIRILPYDRSTAVETARARASLRRRGRPIGAYDVLIAGRALAHGLILVTSNVREFKQVEGLNVEDWRE
jgi:predicted nucleic acid-binding protein